MSTAYDVRAPKSQTHAVVGVESEPDASSIPLLLKAMWVMPVLVPFSFVEWVWLSGHAGGSAAT